MHQDIAYAYYDKRHYDLALNIFQRIIDVSNVSDHIILRKYLSNFFILYGIQEIEIDLLVRTADCYREVGDLETAVVFYVHGKYLRIKIY